MFWFGTVIAVLLVGFFTLVMRANEVCVISVREGRTLLMRGRIPLSLRNEWADVVSRARVKHASLRVVRSGGVPRLFAEGVDPQVAQRLRNVLGMYPDHRLRTAAVAEPRNLGQLLGIPWLAWRLRRRSR